MSYRVVWENECFRQLDVLLGAGASSKQLSYTVEAIADELSVVPHRKGTPLSEGLFRFEFPPLRAYFPIDEGAGLVRIDTIWWIGNAGT
jgi:hypothetical protein